MRTTQVSAQSIQLTRLGFVNCYLVREDDGFTLVDTGLPGTAKQIVQAARLAGLPIRRIVLTHAHMDHVGSVDALLSELKVPLVASARSVPLLRKPPDLSLQAGEPQSKIRGALPGIKSQVTQTLSDGDVVGSLRVIETPGHTPGHIALFDSRDRTLYAGDALVAIGKLTVTGFCPWYFPLPNTATWDKVVAVASAQKLLNIPVERFACGHGVVRGGGLKSLREAISLAK